MKHLDQIITDNELVDFLTEHHPNVLAEYERYCNKNTLPTVGSIVMTLRPGFGGSGDDVRIVEGYRSKKENKTLPTYSSIEDVSYIQLRNMPYDRCYDDSTYCLDPKTWWKDVRIIKEVSVK